MIDSTDMNEELKRLIAENHRLVADNRLMHKRDYIRIMIRDARNDLGLTQREFGKALGYCCAYICQIETGQRLPTVKLTNALCEYFGLDQIGRKVWHRAAASSHGWDVRDE